jgi:hypothetical protein
MDITRFAIIDQITDGNAPCIFVVYKTKILWIPTSEFASNSPSTVSYNAHKIISTELWSNTQGFKFYIKIGD